MATKTSYSCLSLLMLMLFSECMCAPMKFQGVACKLHPVNGGFEKVTRDGLAFMEDGHGVLGANWSGRAYARSYGGY